MLMHATAVNERRDPTPDEAILLHGSRIRCINYAQASIQLNYSTFATDDWLQTW